MREKKRAKKKKSGDVNMASILKAAKAINMPPGRRILHILSQSYEVDDRTGIQNPIGLSTKYRL